MKTNQVELIKKKLQDGIFPMDLSIEEQEVWSKYKNSLTPVANEPVELTTEQDEQLFRWLSDEKEV